MNAGKRAARIVGVLYIIGTVAGILSVVFTGPVLDAPDVLGQVAASSGQLGVGALLVLVMGLSLAMVPVVLFPFFRRHNETLALGYVVFRGGLEAVTYMAMVISWLLLMVLAQAAVVGGTADAAAVQSLGDLLLGAGAPINTITKIVFSLGALMAYTVWYQSRLIPRWLSAWGLVGSVVYLAAGLLALFGVDVEILTALLGLQEMAMALWLIAKGFSAVPTGSTVRRAELEIA